MLVTFSGMVGSGKTTNAHKTLRRLRDLGYLPYYVRFRQISWRSLLRSPAPEPWQEKRPTSQHREDRLMQPALQERQLDPQRRLSVVKFFGYVARILRFRLFLLLHHRRQIVITNRYFYDSFAHYHIDGRFERMCLRLLIAATPQPDLAFLFVLSPESAYRRRPAYDCHGLKQLADNYCNLQNYIDDMFTVRTDDVSMVDVQVEKKVRELFSQKSLSSV